MTVLPSRFSASIFRQKAIPAPVCVFHGILPPNSWQSYHLFHVKATGQTTATLPPLVDEYCFCRSEATPALIVLL